jgi:hypothetical protein
VGAHMLRLHRCAPLPPPLMCECAYPLCRRGLPPRRLTSQARPLLVGISAPINAARRRPCDTPPRQRATSSARAAAACCASAAYLCRPHRCACVRASRHRLPPQPTRRVCVHLVAVCDSTARPYAAPLPRRYQAPQRVPSPRIAISLPRLCVRAPRVQIMLGRTPPQLGAGALCALVPPLLVHTASAFGRRHEPPCPVPPCCSRARRSFFASTGVLVTTFGTTSASFQHSCCATGHHFGRCVSSCQKPSRRSQQCSSIRAVVQIRLAVIRAIVAVNDVGSYRVCVYVNVWIPSIFGGAMRTNITEFSAADEARGEGR